MTEPQQPATTADCDHITVLTWTGDQAGRLWACSDCRRRFYPACPSCVSVGHRGECDPGAASPTREAEQPEADGHCHCVLRPECEPHSHTEVAAEFIRRGRGLGEAEQRVIEAAQIILDRIDGGGQVVTPGSRLWEDTIRLRAALSALTGQERGEP